MHDRLPTHCLQRLAIDLAKISPVPHPSTMKHNEVLPCKTAGHSSKQHHITTPSASSRLRPHTGWHTQSCLMCGRLHPPTSIDADIPNIFCLQDSPGQATRCWQPPGVQRRGCMSLDVATWACTPINGKAAVLRFGQDASRLPRLPCQMDAMDTCRALSHDVYMEVIHAAQKNLGEACIRCSCVGHKKRGRKMKLRSPLRVWTGP